MNDNYKYIPSIDEVITILHGQHPEWTLPMALADWENKAIELENILSKELRKASGIKKMTITALINKINPAEQRSEASDSFELSLDELVSSNDVVCHEIALNKLHCAELDQLIPYEQFVEQCLSSRHKKLAVAAFRVLKRTENEQNCRIIARFREQIMVNTNDTLDAKAEIISCENKPYQGAWIEVTELFDQKESKVVDSKESIFTGLIKNTSS
jgi:hypothetical protein